MSISEARRRANDKWREKFELIQFRVPKGKKQVLQKHAAERGESLNGFLNRAVDQTLSSDDAMFASGVTNRQMSGVCSQK